MNAKRGLSIAAVALAMLSTIGAPPAIASGGMPSSKPRIEVGNDGLHVDLLPLPVGELLQMVAEKTGARIFLYGDRQEKISGQFVEASVTDGLRRLLRGRDLMFFYQERTTATRGRATPRLVELHVFDASAGQSGQLARYAPMSQPFTDSKGGRLGAGERNNLSPGLAALVKLLLEAKNSQARKDAAAALARSGDAAAVEALSHALANDNDPSVRQAVAEALGKSWNAAAVEPLARALSDDRSAAVREAAATALGATWSDNAVDPLIQALANDRDALVREQAARALGNTAGEEAVTALAQTLAQDPRWSVREAAAIALGAIGGSDARDALVRAAEIDSDPWVKEAGLLAILELASH